MIVRKYTDIENPVDAAYTQQFKILAIMLIVADYKKISITKLQTCLWGVQTEENLLDMISWKKSHKVSNAPLVFGEDITPLIMQCISNKLLKTETNKTKKVYLLLDIKAHDFMEKVKNLDLSKEITSRLKRMGKVTEIQLENLQFDF